MTRNPIDNRGAPGEMASLEGLRGVAALLVFVYHARWQGGDPPLVLAGHDWNALLLSMDIGVCIFFVLSGYLLSRPFAGGALQGKWPSGLAGYGVRRMARILPAYYLVLIVFCLLKPGAYTLIGGIGFLLQVFGLHTFTDYWYSGCVPVLWSIGIEIQFYILLPVLMIMAAIGARMGRVVGAMAAIVVFIALADVGAKAVIHGLEGILSPKVVSPSNSHLPDGTVFHFLKWFGVGILLALGESWRGPRSASPSRGWRWDVLFALSCAGFVALLALSSEGQWRHVAMGGWPLNALVCAALVVSAPRSRVGRWWLDGRVARWLGRVSYGVYLWHWPVLGAVFGGTLPGLLGGGVVALVIGSALALSITLVLAWLSWLYIESPVIATARRFASPWAFIQASMGGKGRESKPSNLIVKAELPKQHV